MFYKQILCKTNLITNYIPLRVQVLPGPRDHVIDYKLLVKSGKLGDYGNGVGEKTLFPHQPALLVHTTISLL